MADDLNFLYDELFGFGHDLSTNEHENSNHEDGENSNEGSNHEDEDGGHGTGEGDDNGIGNEAGDGTDDHNDAPCPMPGMVYESQLSLFAAYRDYAKVQGFSVSVRNTSSKYYVVACSKGRKSKAKYRTKQTKCPARVNSKKQDDDNWRVTCVTLEHNHTLEPQLSMMMSGNRELSLHMQRVLEARDIAGYRIVENVRTMEVMAGGPQSLGVTGRDCRNFIDQRRRLRLGEGDAEAIHRLFTTMQLQDSKFFHTMDVDDEGRLRNVMWVHPRGRAAYEDFHDAITFDTTYLVNRYHMPLATVVGVNQHHQSILLGCGLLTHEDAESFKWFFSNWLQAMGGVHPTAMLTDQCESIRNAVKEILPYTIHRFCLWHIAYKMPSKFKGVADYQSCSADFYSTVYDSLSITEFETRWTDFVAKHGLENNNWAKDLFDERENWAPIYLNHMFWAGMVSTQRSESMHAFFDGYINSRSTLKSFVEQYEIAIHSKLQKEMEADYKSKCVSLLYQSNFLWERQFLRVYTHNVSLLLHNEMKKIQNCNVEDVVASVNGVEKFKILEMRLVDNTFHKQYTHTVEYRSIGEYISCSCRKFEFKGLLCVHILKVLVYKDINNVHERYILRRWRKDVYRPHSSIIFAGGYPQMTEEYKLYHEMEKGFVECADVAIYHPERVTMVKEVHKKLLDDLKNFIPPLRSGASRNAENGDGSGSGTRIGDPMIVRRRGRPRNATRIQSGRERNENRTSRGRGQNRSSGGRGRGRGSNVAT